LLKIRRPTELAELECCDRSGRVTHAYEEFLVRRGGLV